MSERYHEEWSHEETDHDVSDNEKWGSEELDNEADYRSATMSRWAIKQWDYEGRGP